MMISLKMQDTIIGRCKAFLFYFIFLMPGCLLSICGERLFFSPVLQSTGNVYLYEQQFCEWCQSFKQYSQTP